MSKSILITLAIICSSAFLLSSCTSKGDQSDNLDLGPQSDSSAQSVTISPTNIMENDTVLTLNTKYGPIALKLFPQQAPKTVANFVAKANQGFYQNLNFHRVEPGFVVQGGDPLGNGTGGGTITSEINSIPFKRGSLGLARGGIKSESNDSQFFICLSDQNCSHLTNEYVNFGEVISGMEFVDQIQVGDKIVDITPYTK